MGENINQTSAKQLDLMIDQEKNTGDKQYIGVDAIINIQREIGVDEIIDKEIGVDTITDMDTQVRVQCT